MEQEHTGTAIWWRRGAEDHWHFQQMMVADEDLAVSAALREGYIPKDAEVVRTEPTYTNRQQAAYAPHPTTMGLETKSWNGIFPIR